MNRLFVVGAIILGCVLIGCTEKQPGAEPSPFASVLDEPPGAEPSPFASALEEPPGAQQTVEPFTSPLSTQEGEDLPLLERDPTPKAGLATVRGELVLNGRPAMERTLYLAPIIYSAEGGGSEMAALDAVNDPRAQSDRSGYFHFVNVEPGRYALGINSPIGPVLIKQGKSEITLDVVPDEITDVGIVRIVPFD